MWWASADAPYPAKTARGRTRRARASTARSSTRKPLPSAITNPSRPASNGREAEAGSASRRDSAPMRAKPVTVSGVTLASVPPATTTSHRPCRIRSSAVPRAVAPEAQAVAVTRLGPVKPRSIATCPATMLGSISGMNRGEIPSGPRSPIRRAWRSQVETPPRAVPTTTATRSAGYSPRSIPASATASRAATTASWTNLSCVRALRAPTRSEGLKSGTVHEMSTGAPASAGSVRAVDVPEHTDRHVCSVPIPAAVTRPSPVTTTVPPLMRRVPPHIGAVRPVRPLRTVCPTS
jgi:hypothetical protein